MSYPYSITTYPTYEARVLRGGLSGYPEKERDKRPGHIFPRKTYQKEKEEPIDGRYFHTQMGYVPVQIVDADKLRRDQEGDREDKAREERRRVERREDVTTLRQTWEATDYLRKLSHSSRHRDRHMYNHRRSTRVYQADPRESSTPSPPHIPNKYVVKQEYVSQVKEYEVYQPKKEQAGRDTKSGPNEYCWGRGYIRTRA